MSRYIYDPQTGQEIPSFDGDSPESIAPIEYSPATAQHAIGDRFYFNGILTKAKTAIAVNDTLVWGTNIEESDSLQEQVDTLKEALSKQTLFFSSVACAATTGNFATVSNANISADHVLVECTFANPSAITTDVTWTTSNGSLVLNGTCASATTANITLSKKGN